VHLRNDGSSGTAEQVSAILSTSDPRVNAIGGNLKTFGDIGPGQTAASSGDFVISLSNLTGNDTITFSAAISSGGWHFWDDSAAVTLITTVIEDRTDHAPAAYSLKQNYPNPFNPGTIFEFSIPKAEHVTIKLHDISGKEAAQILSAPFPAGQHKYKWQPESLAGGVYYYTIQAGGFKQTKKLILLR